MKTTLILLISLCCATIAFAQNELKGTWVLESYAIDGKKPTRIKERVEKDKIMFDGVGRYAKRYYESELPDSARIHMTYNFLDGKVTKKYFDKAGDEIKIVRMRKKTDNGTYEQVGADQLKFTAARDSNTKVFKIDGQHLSIADTVDNRVIWSRYKKRS